MPDASKTRPAGEITLRPACADDVGFLRYVYATTREDELKHAGFDEQRRKAFMDMQFAAQSADYRRRFPDGHHDVILLGQERIGRLYVARSEAEIRILDITILPAYRGGGIGAHLIGKLLDESRSSGKRVRIYLDNGTAATRLFVRLGFARIERQDFVSLYEWLPPDA